MSWSGCSATSGSRLFMSIRMAASCGQPLQVSAVPRGARTSRAPGLVITKLLGSAGVQTTLSRVPVQLVQDPGERLHGNAADVDPQDLLARGREEEGHGQADQAIPGADDLARVEGQRVGDVIFDGELPGQALHVERVDAEE